MNNKITYYHFMRILMIILILLNLLLAIVYPILLTFSVLCFLFVLFLNTKLKTENRNKKEQENFEKSLIEKGYIKIYNNFYVNQGKKNLIINKNKYSFSQIIDYKLIEEYGTINQTIGKTKGKVKNNGKLKSKNISTTVGSNFCTELYINIIVNNINESNIKLDLRKSGYLPVNGIKYKKLQEDKDKIISILELIKANKETLI